MATVLITCPQTRRPVATGLELDTLSFIWATRREQRLHCPACGRVHRWTKEDAYLPPHPPPRGFHPLFWRWRSSSEHADPDRESPFPWIWVQVGGTVLIVVAAWFLVEGPGGIWIAGLLGR